MYFVTEDFIKKFFGPLFKGMTATNSPSKINELLNNITKVQAEDEGKFVQFVNHMDFSKWINFLSYESTCPLFKAMDKFMGLNNVIEKT